MKAVEYLVRKRAAEGTQGFFRKNDRWVPPKLYVDTPLGRLEVVDVYREDFYLIAVCKDPLGLGTSNHCVYDNTELIEAGERESQVTR